MQQLFLYNKIQGSEAEKQQFEENLLYIAELLKTNADWLMIVMQFESGLKPNAVNSKTGATGLIQFMPQTAINLGTTTDELKSMNSVQQLTYVYKYLKPYKGKLNTLTDVYLTVFYPYAINKPDNYVLGSQVSQEQAEKIAVQNKVFDINGDGVIQKIEIINYINAFAKALGYKESTQKNESAPDEPEKKKKIIVNIIKFAFNIIKLIANGIHKRNMVR